LHLERPMSSMFTWFSSSWPKTNYIEGLLSVPKGGRQRKHEIHEIEAAASRQRKIGEGTAAGIAFGRLSSFINASTLISTIRGN
jgi:hypothetical protein